ncbi:hypothetical protein [Actinacidiphila oryziradicis]|uniref:YokE-like PH domain-containing protein n=1 Tax=Actinacidiphila oryziradicis TaxID=2571141 RepID=A0A4U0SKZ8_9ACTN|nr:hypothetical protein [Actinacidiphila oryziradicis]MCW2870816.1 hypothetical protein [Actinacidiphila oryziradicis]TKA08801.1 hypothetical protein FCI23_25910 [Actinacidiphila oryziradicis]
MSEPEFSATGVRIGRRLRSLTLGGQVLIRDGRLVLLTSRGREIDSAPVEDVHTLAPRFAVRRRALATVNGTGYLLTLRRQGAASAARFVDALRTAREGVGRP